MGGDGQARLRPLRRTVLIGLGAGASGLLLARLHAAGAATPDDSAQIAGPRAKTAADTARAVLYEEDPGDRNGKRFAGTVRWSVDTRPPAGNATPVTMVRAGVAIPERQMTLNWTLLPNQDRSLPATHTIDLMFAVAEEFSHGGIQNVPGLLMKQGEQTRGTPLKGLAVKVTEGYFLIGLSAAEGDRNINLQLLREREWIDMPIVYQDGRRAILAIEKGAAGARAFRQAFAAWDGAGPSPLSTDTK
jgi:hypothetical protein